MHAGCNVHDACPRPPSLTLLTLGVGAHRHNVSAYYERSFPAVLFQHRSFPGDLHAAISGTLSEIQSSMILKMDCTYSGTTACIAVVLKGIVHFANVGDSRAVVVSRSSKGLTCTALTTDHKPDHEAERARIVGAGGTVRKSHKDKTFGSPSRVYVTGTDAPGLAMSRSLGDTQAHSVGVSAIPTFSEHRLGPADTHVILGSDGLFDALDRSEICGALTACQSQGHGIKRAVLTLAEMSDALYAKFQEEPDDITVCGCSVEYRGVVAGRLSPAIRLAAPQQDNTTRAPAPLPPLAKTAHDGLRGIQHASGER